MEIKHLKIDELNPAEYNPRRLTKEQYKHLKESIEIFGLVDPLIVNKDNTVIGGHQRLRIAKDLNIQDVPVVYVDLDKEKERELNLRLNKNMGEWDWDKLANEFDTDLLLDIGFEEKDLGIDFDPDEKDDEVPEIQKEAKSKIGEIYQLGSHRVMCGDSTKVEDVEILMDCNKADLLFTSPPYSNMRDYGGDKDLSLDLLSQFIHVFKEYTDYQVINLGIQRKDGQINPYWDVYIGKAKDVGYKLLSWNVWNREEARTVSQACAMFPIQHEWLFVFGIEKKDIRSEEHTSELQSH